HRTSYLIPYHLHHATPTRPPHSFPTRRSSDLGGERNDDASRERVGAGRIARRDQQSARDRDDARAGIVHVHVRVFHRPKKGVDQDRKSTRLNSSHVSISYAVFCLKKKKK